jgi:putative ABC transport system permease protein
MLKNYLKISVRNLGKQKVFSFINVFGLSVGIACFSLFLLYSVNEFSYDNFHKNSSSIYRVYEWFNSLNGQDGGGEVNQPIPLGPALKKDFPDVLNYVRFQNPWDESLVRIGRNVSRVNITYADPAVFSVFTFPLKYGNASTALSNLNDIVLTDSKAKDLFGDDNVVGKVIQIKIDSSFVPFTISGIAEDIPANSTIRFDALGNFLFAETTANNKSAINDWGRIGWQTYVQLRPGSLLANDTQQLIRFRQTYHPDEIATFKKNGFTWKGSSLPITYRFQPLSNIHTDTKVHEATGIDPKTIWILMAIASGILLIACINFTTLAIGRSVRRSKEVGVRKVMGARVPQIIFQFLTEALLLTIVSTIIGLLLAILLLPYFNKLSGVDLQFSFSLYPQMIWLMIVLVLFVGVTAGSYPALVLSNFKPVEVLKNKIKVVGSNLFTKSLVTFQFALSIALIVSTIIILQQTKYLISKNPGFNKENVVVIDASDANPDKIFPSFKQSLVEYPEIEGVTNGAGGLGEGQSYFVQGFKYKDKGRGVFFNFVDTDYMKVLGMKLILGTGLNTATPGDSTLPIVVNETMMNDFGWNLQNVIGTEISNYQGKRSAYVVGVVKDFNYQSLDQKVNDQLFQKAINNGNSNFYIRIKPGNPSEAIELIQRTWETLVPDAPIKYSFLDEDVNNYYKAEQRWSSVVGWAGGISIFLACLGLFGLAALAVVNREKEIGIRKVLGASVAILVLLVAKDFLRLILIAFIIAVPVAWWAMNKWLQDYANRISISIWVFIIAGLVAVLIAGLTLGYHTLKAALANPVKSLRTE